MKSNMAVLSIVCEKTYTYELDNGKKRLTTPKDAADAARPTFEGKDREHFAVLMMNTKNMPIGINIVSIGSLSASIVHPRELFKAVILKNASSIILVHNHPSGCPEPSNEDLEVTRRITDAGNILGINVRDHIIIANTDEAENSFFSFRENGLMLS